ncbi:hypothetical protein ACJ5NV_03570 [Loktanella agnita]|uniref:hypothetical protein n=1 Tax=Loktanella agnita TaxID=287097 RepID=UPI0039880A64
MIIQPSKITNFDGRCRIAAMVELETPGRVFTATGTAQQELWIDWPADYFVPDKPDGGPFALICLSVAMSLKERLVIGDPICQSLLINILEAMEIYKTDFPDICDVIQLETVTYHRPKSETQRVGSFYSGGVDSLYNIAEHKRLQKQYGILSVTDLWLIQGMDIKLSDDALWHQTKSLLSDPEAWSEGMCYVDIRTNARDIHDKFAPWEQLGFGPILGGIAKCFSPIVGTALIGSYAKYTDIIPHASSPLVDPMWSCGRQTVRHFSCRASRIEKIETIAGYAPELLQNLRVCYLNPEGAYNCGRCEKCLRTQMQLMLCNCLDECKMFDQPLTPQSLQKLQLPWQKKNHYTWDFWRDIQRACQLAGHDDFDRILSKQLRRNKFSRLRKRIKAAVRSLRKSTKAAVRSALRRAR